jgi:nucleotide-binding universal stress UspA family protein
MKTILVPTDFSKNAKNALHYAVNIAKRMQAKIILLHSFHIDNNNAALPVDMVDKQVETAKKKSDADLKAHFNSVSHNSMCTIEYISSNNFLVDEILRLTEERDIDLIVMGTQGASGKLGKQIFGTNSSNVIEKAKCPVLTIPEGASTNDIKTIVYSTEYLNSDVVCLQTLADMAKLFEANIQVVHIALFDDAENKKALEDFKVKVSKNVDYKNISYKLLIGNNVEQRIEGYMEEEKVDMLVMSAHHRSLMDKLFGKSITKVMAFYLKVPLMVFHHHRTKLDDASDHTVAKLIF